ncbi:MAG TPA: hypothetical protein PLD84_04495 [Chitinophagales bacterium]|nr:hypothetical protein [Chitinophagales bacterium]
MLKFILFIVMSIFCIYILYLTLPEWIGWFEETDAYGIIDSINADANYPKTYIEFSYWNKYEKRLCHVSYSKDNRMMTELSTGDSIKINYKPFFPGRVSIHGLNYSKLFNDFLLLCIFIGALLTALQILRLKK